MADGGKLVYGFSEGSGEMKESVRDRAMLNETRAVPCRGPRTPLSRKRPKVLDATTVVC
jgi:hypothetical protein